MSKGVYMSEVILVWGDKPGLDNLKSWVEKYPIVRKVSITPNEYQTDDFVYELHIDYYSGKQQILEFANFDWVVYIPTQGYPSQAGFFGVVRDC